MTEREEMLKAVKRLIDYECNDLRYWLTACEQQHDTVEWSRYQFVYNSLVVLRERMISPNWVLQFLDKEKFDMPEATERVFSSPVQNKDKA